MRRGSQFLATALCALATVGWTAGVTAPPSRSPAEAGVQQRGPWPPASAGEQVFAGGWEGEAETDRWPLFLTLQLEQGQLGLGGKLLVLGQTVALEDVQAAGNRLTIRVGEGPGALLIEAAIEGEELVGRLKHGKEDLPFQLRRIPDYPAPANRVEAWGQDLDALEQRFLAVDRSFSPVEKAAFLKKTAALRERLPALSDAEIVMGMASAIALSGNAHSRLYLLRNRTELRRMPIRLWWFADGLRVVRAAPEHRRLLGCRVDAIGGVAAREARAKVAPAFAGNEAWIDYKSVYSLTSPEALSGMGVTRRLEPVEYRFADCAAAGDLALAPLPLARSTKPVEAWWDLSPAHSAQEPGWVQALAGGAAPPLYLKDPNRYYWYEYLPESGILYFQYNRASQMKEENTKAFGERLLAAIDWHKPRAFVLDLRFNTGGDTGLASELMETLRGRTKGMKRFLVTGRATFSAGIAHAAGWRMAPDVVFVGEPVGDVMDFWSEGGNIILPNSGLAAHFANGAHSYSPAPCPDGVYCLDMSAPALGPDRATPLSWADYRRGIDPAMAAVEAAVR